MAVENNKNQEEKIKNQKKVNIGDMIQINKGEAKGKKGKIIALLDNSVIVEIGMNVKTDEPIKTVVNHKNYKLL
ncbi:DUF2187 family protein [Cytobacillus sp.]|uniref:DUF2187 family protein n=1 Tax=Cytobacillus sp. TaxID=2675269 RepID=UPI0028BE3398|nr:DUF2187 family protein [Cytobacillus sp.]